MTQIEMDSELTTGDLMQMAADIIAAHTSNNTVAPNELPELIEQVFHKLQALSAGEPAPEPLPEPAVPIKKSVTRDYIICLEDGRKLKMLKRHLSTAYGMTPDEYRERWGLPADYPMVAPAYAETRRNLAVQIGLGKGSTGRKKKKV